MPKIISVDPGMTTGWAVFDSTEGEIPIEFGEVRYDEEDIWDWLSAVGVLPEATIWVVEDYHIRPAGHFKSGYGHTWSKGATLRVIGACEAVARLAKHKFILQQPSIKPIGYKLMGEEYEKGKKTKLTHIKDAIAHGRFYIHKHGLVE